VGKHRIALAVTVIGAVLIAAHVALGVAGTMTAGQWQSGVVIGLILLVGGGISAAMTR
jgi:hypothetical protein